jgi:CheY-like chemotaxis protein
MSRRPVLVVDDDHDIREAIRDVLEMDGYETIDAPDGTVALDYLRSHSAPGLILLDWNMAPMNGPQFMNELSREPALAAIPVVLFTADSRIEDKVQHNGFTGFLRKPIDLNALVAFVGQYCE